MKKSEKIIYEIDPHNRLIFRREGSGLNIPKYRKIIDGKFIIGERNSLTYHIKKSQGLDVPQEIKFSGSWFLDKGHNLVFMLDKWNNQVEGNKLIIKGEIISASEDEFVFSVATRNSSGENKIYILKLGGAWQANRDNRLAFNIEREKGFYDILTLEGIWQLNRHNEIIYTYAKESLKRKIKITKSITFKGYWDIIDRHRISYILSKELNSKFEFKASFGKILNDSIEYELGIGAAPEKRRINLFGQWKFDKKLGLAFEVEYENKKAKTIIFGASYKIDKDSNLEVGFKNRAGEELGVEAKLSKKICKGEGEAFLETLLSKKEKAISAGIGFRW